MKDARLLLHKLTRVNLSLFHKLRAALLARCRIAPQKNEKQARRSWKLRLFSNKRPLRILLDFKSMNPHWLLQFPYAALIMIVYYCHSCMYFRKKSRELRESCGWKKRSMRIPPEITARIPAGGCFAARRKAGKEKRKMEKCVEKTKNNEEYHELVDIYSEII